MDFLSGLLIWGGLELWHILSHPIPELPQLPDPDIFKPPKLPEHDPSSELTSPLIDLDTLKFSEDDLPAILEAFQLFEYDSSNNLGDFASIGAFALSLGIAMSDINQAIKNHKNKTPQQKLLDPTIEKLFRTYPRKDVVEKLREVYGDPGAVEQLLIWDEKNR